ncbi:MAG TPA: hypothetical protein VML55_12195 [Planctomycetaceae bacterium]|nr:hypothetical protein [Planctomycetaceae bacterium]
MRRTLLTAAGLWLAIHATGFTAGTAEPPDLSSIVRSISKEPAYSAEKPLYGLYVFGPEAKTHVWAVFDKSDAEAETYDVLYFDRNANGDLTEPDERIEGSGADANLTFDIGDFTDALAGQTHTGLNMSRRTGQNPMVMFRMNWCDKVMVRGGYAPEPGPYTEFAESPEDAPVLWPGADGPFSFQFWTPSPLTIGREDDVRVFLGQRGHGPSTFCAVPDTFLPKEIPVLATLVYTDANGKEQRARSELRERC